MPAWAYALSVAAILGIGMVLYWGNPWQSKKTENTGIVSEGKNVALNTPASPSPDQPKNDTQKAVIAEKETEPESKHSPAATALQPLPFAGKRETLRRPRCPTGENERKTGSAR